MALIPKDPLDWLILFRQQINEIFNYLSLLEAGEKGSEREYVPLIDIFETADRFLVEAELPGFAPEDLSVSICCNMLVVEGTKRQDPPRKEGAYLCLERNFGRFCRTVEIPPGFDLAGVRARYVRGVLRVAFPRLPGKGAIIRTIPIEQGDVHGNES
ncbi:MAG TPA: Hsp20/alpha crystallin family protein [Geobacteraceae bacterium]